jgi:hypothetical protein
LNATPAPDLHGQGKAPLCFKGSPLACSLRLECRPSGASLTVSGVLFGVRSLRPVTSLFAPDGSASRELRFAQYPALRLTSQRFVRASLGLTASARCCHAACRLLIAGCTPTAPPRPHLKRPPLRCGLLLYFKNKKWRLRGLHTMPPTHYGCGAPGGVTHKAPYATRLAVMSRASNLSAQAMPAGFPHCAKHNGIM